MYLVIASSNTLMSCTEPGHPAIANVNIMSKSQLTTGHHILGSDALVTQVLDKQLFGHHNRDVSATYCPNTVLEEGIEPTVHQS